MNLKPFICVTAALAFVIHSDCLAKMQREEVALREVPKFGDYSVALPKTGAAYSSKLVFTSSYARRYRTVISQEGKKEPNFAGHYRVVTWGCGTDCHGFAIVNRVTGQVYTSPSIKYVAGVMGNAESRISYKRDSCLFVLTGLLNDEIEGNFFYKWTGNQLKMVFKRPVVKEDL